MFFEGRCTLRQLPVRIRDAVLAVDNSLLTPAPLWEMVSSNVGTLKTDDGYVFRSQGTDGKSNIVWGIKSEVDGFFYGGSSWTYGYRLFMAKDYTPGAAGVNGTFGSNITHGTVVATNQISGVYADTISLRYWISVKKDRVLLAYRSEVRSGYSRINFHYIGRPLRLFDSRDTVSCFGSAIPFGGNNTYGTVWVSRKNAFIEDIDNQSLVWNTPSVNRMFGGKVMPSRPVLKSGPNLRGIMDYYILPQDGRLRAIDTLTIKGVEYVALEIPASQTVDVNALYYNNLSPTNTTSIYLIPKD